MKSFTDNVQRFLLSVLISTCSLVSVVVGQANIPVMNWQPQSDWLNVKSASYNAKGDGTTDDADAINSALNALATNGKNTVYFPAGTYRITKQLVMGTTGNKQQCQVLGTGRTTIIKCDFPSGSLDSAMLHPRGAWAGEFNGITWDGNNKARIGIHHTACGFNYEGDIIHQNMAFLNFTGSAIKSYERYDPCTSWNPTAEIVIRNCLFINCKKGISTLYFNEFNWNIEGCEFRNCGVGVRTQAYGNAYIRFCHFENSSEYDIQSEFASGNSIRWCTSLNSRRFVWGQRIYIQDCVVKGIQEKDSAIVLGSTRGTFIVSDLFMQEWNSTKSPLVFNVYSDHDQEFSPINDPQELIVSNVQCSGAAVPTTVWSGGSGTATITQIPAGSRTTPMFNAEKSFLKTTINLRNGVKVPTGTIFNVKTLGAAGNGSTNDATIIQNAINQASAAGNNACVYFPPGNYKVNSTIAVTGSNYYIMGTGIGSSFTFGGGAGNPVFLVAGARNVAFMNLGFRSEVGQRCATCPAIKHVGSATAKSFVTYERVWTYGPGYRILTEQPNGLLFENLTANDTVVMNQCPGQLRVKNSSQGIVVGIWSPFTITVIEGTTPKTGFLGMVAGNVGQTRIYNSHNLVFGDMNVEQSDMNAIANYCDIVLSGQDGDTPGRVTISSARQAIQSTDTIVRMNNYRGTFSFLYGEWGADAGLGATGYKFTPTPASGANPIYMLFAGCKFPGDRGIATIAQRPKILPRAIDSMAILECHFWVNTSTVSPNTTTAKETALNKTAEAFNDFRTLGQWVYKLDYDSSAVTGARGNRDNRILNFVKPTIGFNGSRIIVSCAQKFTVEIFTIQGALVCRSFSNNPDGGIVTIPFKNTSGTYLTKVITKEGAVFEKMVTLR